MVPDLQEGRVCCAGDGTVVTEVCRNAAEALADFRAGNDVSGFHSAKVGRIIWCAGRSHHRRPAFRE